MPPQAPVAVAPQFPVSETRPASARMVTSRAAWRRGLPTGINPALLDACNDDQPNDQPLGRPAPAKRELRLEALLGWAYRQQQAHRILYDQRDWLLWAMDEGGYLSNPRDRRQVHYDAALVHEAVLALGTEAAARIIECAVTGMWPELVEDEDARFYPVEPSDKYDDFGRHVRGDGSRFQYLIRTAEIVSVPQEEYELAGRKKMRRAKAASWEQVPVRYCPLRWEPEPEYVEAENRRVAAWQEAREALIAALRDAPFRDHVLSAANDNEEPAANDNDPLTFGA